MMRWGYVGTVVAFGLSLCLSPLAAWAEPAYVSVVREYVETVVKPMVNAAIVRKAIEEQNTKFGNVSDMDIQVLDNTYRSEIQAGGWQMVRHLLAKPVSRYLKSKQDDSQGAIIEFFVTDRHGLNVGQGTMTTDYWQGDEDKFLKTFARQSDEIFIDRAERDEQTQVLETQASFVIKDENGKPIGVATVTIAIDAL
ncbi:PDC sensor domain-containing protein [Rhizobium sp. T1470]|uniref:PDC sensor domain-containing protein n=1 Tax=unclassified Rhizobium TaxID=2613769 RepID=UPI001AAFAEE7|nr:PDC sensor domain-containing protein [Rhizobium sp. T1473]MCA0801617.1 PDC sensor domain-containing protein [Rhizobium sp. T1473]